MYDKEGNRFVDLELRLKEIEDKFIQLRDNILQKHQTLRPEDKKTIALFAATMYARTKRQKREEKLLWQDYISFINSLPSEISLLIKQMPEYKQVVEVNIEQPMPYHLFHFVNITSQYLYQMNCAIYETSIRPGLITCDNPCLWIDPTILDPAIPKTFFGVGSPNLNILMPISPKQYIILERNGHDGYVYLDATPEIEENVIDPLNSIIAANCDEYIVVSQEILKECWFDLVKD